MIDTAYIRQNARESAAWDRPVLVTKLEQCADEIERLRAQNEQLDVLQIPECAGFAVGFSLGTIFGAMFVLGVMHL